MENEISNNTENTKDSLIITQEGRKYLVQSSKWANLLAILGFIGLGFVAFIGLVLIITGSFIQSNIPLNQKLSFFSFSWIGVIYIAMGVLYFFPTYYLYQFATKIRTALYENNQETLNEGLKNQKRMFTFIGVMTIAFIAIYVVLIPIAFIFGFAYTAAM